MIRKISLQQQLVFYGRKADSSAFYSLLAPHIKQTYHELIKNSSQKQKVEADLIAFALELFRDFQSVKSTVNFEQWYERKKRRLKRLTKLTTSDDNSDETTVILSPDSIEFAAAPIKTTQQKLLSFEIQLKKALRLEQEKLKKPRENYPLFLRLGLFCRRHPILSRIILTTVLVTALTIILDYLLLLSDYSLAVKLSNKTGRGFSFSLPQSDNFFSIISKLELKKIKQDAETKNTAKITSDSVNSLPPISTPNNTSAALQHEVSASRASLKSNTATITDTIHSPSTGANKKPIYQKPTAAAQHIPPSSTQPLKRHQTMQSDIVTANENSTSYGSTQSRVFTSEPEVADTSR